MFGVRIRIMISSAALCSCILLLYFALLPLLFACLTGWHTGRNVSSQNSSLDAPITKLAERGHDFVVIGRATQIKVEAIFPRATFHWPAFDLKQIDSAPRERLEGIVQRAGPMRECDNQRQLVCAFREICGRREQEKARVVFAAVLQMLAQNHAAIL